MQKNHEMYLQLVAVTKGFFTISLYYNDDHAASVGIQFFNRNAFYADCCDIEANILPFHESVDLNLWVSSVVMQSLSHSFAISVKRQAVTDFMSVNDNVKHMINDCLYLPLIPVENREEWLDSECKVVVCESCGSTYDGETAYWVSDFEECPECDHVQHEHKRESVNPVTQ